MELTVDALAGVADLYPASTPTGSVKFSITNPNPFAIEVTDVAANGSVSPDNATECPASNVTIGTLTGLGGAPYQLAASTEMTVDDVLAMAVDAPTGCQGRTFTVPLEVTARLVAS